MLALAAWIWDELQGTKTRWLNRPFSRVAVYACMCVCVYLYTMSPQTGYLPLKPLNMEVWGALGMYRLSISWVGIWFFVLMRYVDVNVDIVDGAEIPNNHLGWLKENVNNGTTYQLVQDFFHQQDYAPRVDLTKDPPIMLKWRRCMLMKLHKIAKCLKYIPKEWLRR